MRTEIIYFVFVKLLEPPVTDETYSLRMIRNIPHGAYFKLYLALAVRPESDSRCRKEFSPHHAFRTAADLTHSTSSWAFSLWLKQSVLRTQNVLKSKLSVLPLTLYDLRPMRKF